jgi:peptidyl-prolyl cis-trans isomerase SurA
MTKKIWVCLLGAALCTSAYTQTLFTYGKNAVSKDEFLRAFSKNSAPVDDKAKAMKEYLELYIKFKLKVQAAYDLKLDTLPTQRYELANFRNQVVDSYINNDESYNAIVDEAFVRSQQDIALSHIFIAAGREAKPEDTLKAWKQINEVYGRLRGGAEFPAMTAQFSTDASNKNNGGQLGYITVFSLPYEIENLVYNTPAGSYTKPYRSKIGYHIFKVNNTRKAVGKVKIAQILIAYPPDADEAVKAATARKADSVYALVMKPGADFGNLALEFSNDMQTANNRGELTEFGVGKYSPDFENLAFGLQQDGEITKPFKTSLGYHIVKRIGRIAVPADTKDAAYLKLLRQQVIEDSRVEKAKKVFLGKILQQAAFRRAPVNETSLWAITDSVMQGKTVTKPVGNVSEKTPLFFLKGQTVKVGDWLMYARAMRNIAQSKGTSYKELLGQYLDAVGFEYYRNHLEDYNLPFRYQLQEFKEGNLLFEVMQKQVWDKAAADNSALQKFYTQNKTKYNWEPSANAIIFTCPNIKTATELYDRVSANPAKWAALRDEYVGKVQIDSGRFELGQIPVSERTAFSDGLITSIATYPPDSTAAFAYVMKVYRERGQRSFEEAKGFVINDYQNQLEEQWINDLRKKYAVKVNEATLKAMMK